MYSPISVRLCRLVTDDNDDDDDQDDTRCHIVRVSDDWSIIVHYFQYFDANFILVAGHAPLPQIQPSCRHRWQFLPPNILYNIKPIRLATSFSCYSPSLPGRPAV